jgi:hypothetical protein
MNVNFSLAAVLSVAASAVFALPAQAGVLITPTNAGGSVGDPGAAYGIDGLEVDGTTYDVRFNFGSFYGLYGNPPAAGDAILAALSGQSITKLVEANVASYGSNILSNFYIPEFSTGQNPNQATFLNCVTGATACSTTPNYRDPSQSDSVLFAQFTAVPNTTAVPTPALLPGLMGLGLAALRKKKLAAAVDV